MRVLARSLLLVAALALLVLPGVGTWRLATADDLGAPEPPAVAHELHRAISPGVERWARERLASGVADRVATEDIAATEWPLFGTAFFLLATEELERSPRGDPPSAYARGAIDASVALLVDPGHARWVREKWGAGYLHRENVFYRMLLVQGLVADEQLGGGGRHRALLADQVESLAAELAAEPGFLLDDYPGECYPADVVWAVAGILRADALLGTDHRALVAPLLEALRGVEDPGGLPAFFVQRLPERRAGPSRGSGTSSLLAFAPELDATAGAGWLDAYERGFWGERALFAGFSEHPRAAGIDFWADVDAGPVLFGHGVSASAFGIAATRAGGRLDRARVLSAEALASSAPLPGGGLGVPRLLSRAGGAPYLGESGLLFALTRRPAEGVRIVAPAGGLPAYVHLLTLGPAALGLLLAGLALRGGFRR